MIQRSTQLILFFILLISFPRLAHAQTVGGNWKEKVAVLKDVDKTNINKAKHRLEESTLIVVTGYCPSAKALLFKYNSEQIADDIALGDVFKSAGLVVYFKSETIKEITSQCPDLITSGY